MALFVLYRGHALVKACDYNEQLPLSKCFSILETVYAVCCRDTTSHLKPLRNSSIFTQPSLAKPRSWASSAKTSIVDFGYSNCFFTSVATLSLSSQSKSSPKSWHAAQDSVEEWCVTMQSSLQACTLNCLKRQPHKHSKWAPSLSCASKFDSSITGFMISVHRSILLNLAHHASDFKQALCNKKLWY